MREVTPAAAILPLTPTNPPFFFPSPSALCAVIDDPDVSLSELMRLMPAPDFPTGGELLDLQSLRQAYATGRGAVTVRAKVHEEVVAREGVMER